MISTEIFTIISTLPEVNLTIGALAEVRGQVRFARFAFLTK